MQKFKIESDYTMTGDQPKAVETLARGIFDGEKHQTLMGVTGSGKTFTMRNKENAKDYRYFPEPDIVPLYVDEDWKARVRETIPELPDELPVQPPDRPI